MLTGAEYILKKISLLGIKYVFGVPGAHVDPLFITAVSSEVTPIINCHELSAGYMADGYGRASNKLGVLIGIGGPGSNSMVTAVNTARVEKKPLLIITGDVPVSFSDVPGFQCANEIGTNDDAIFKAITKHSKRIENINSLASSIDEAVEIALTPPLGPSHLIVPFNILNELTTIVPKEVNYDLLRYWKNDISDDLTIKIKKLILSDKKLIFWIGDSLNYKEQAKHIIALADKFHIPVATSYTAKGVLSEDHELALGNFGFAGSSLSKELFLSEEPDVIIGFDIEQNERNSLNWNPNLYNGKKLILINFPGSYSNNKYGETFENNPLYVLKSLHSSLMKESYDFNIRQSWFKSVIQKINLETVNIPASNNERIEPGTLIQILNKEMPRESILFVDSGNHRIFPGFYYKAKMAEAFYSASSIAPLGWGIAAAIGCKFVRDEPVVLFTGDGCMQMHGIELRTAVKFSKALLVIITNNNALGSIHGRYLKVSKEAAKMVAISTVDWNMFLKSLSAEVYNVTTEEDFTNHIQDFFTNQRLLILNVKTKATTFIHDRSLAKSAF